MPALRTRDTHSAARALEVSTVAPPSLTIISPTPRAFTFPVRHNLADSPYSSPSNSPFEPDLRALALSASSASTTPTSSVSSHNDECRTPPPLSAFTRTLSPVSTPGSPPAIPIRRKSTSAAVALPEERRPKKGDDDYVKRPENAFILFRRKCCEDRASASAPSLMAGPSSADSPSLAANAPGTAKKQRQADLSKTISQQWKALSPAERALWEALAKEKKREHETLHPNYVYRPQRTGAKNRSTNAAASGSSSTTPAQRRKNSAPQVEFVIPAPRGRGTHSRSASAPTPPPYQAIHVPNVYLPASGSGSFSMDPDADASLLPLLVRHGVGNGNGGFDYLPTFSGAYDFEASLQSSDFLRSMFPTTISPTSPPSDAGGAILSPASSTSGSGPSSPYTPATGAFHPSAFTSAYAAPSDPTALDAALAYPSADGLGLSAEADAHAYTSYASAWAASSPWASAAPSAGLTESDFDIGRIPEIGWDLGCGTGTASAYGGAVEGGDEFPAMYEYGGEAGPGASGDGGELDMHFGEMDMDMGGFDDMMAGRGF
ncbi:hypothetical protein C8R46DRAFT_1294851 [Mycena filopes]|nr:hypothetical protein C8R46DRAFT_1294851 [Mycena filopes]